MGIKESISWCDHSIGGAFFKTISTLLSNKDFSHRGASAMARLFETQFEDDDLILSGPEWAKVDCGKYSAFERRRPSDPLSPTLNIADPLSPAGQAARFRYQATSDLQDLDEAVFNITNDPRKEKFAIFWCTLIDAKLKQYANKPFADPILPTSNSPEANLRRQTGRNLVAQPLKLVPDEFFQNELGHIVRDSVPVMAEHVANSANALLGSVSPEGGPFSNVLSLFMRANTSLKWSDDRLMGVLSLMPSFHKLINVPEDAPLKERMDMIVSRSCRFADVEAVVRDFDDANPITCAISDAIFSTATCLPIPPPLIPQTAKTVQSQCAIFEKGWSTHAFEELLDFPVDNLCYPPRPTLQLSEAKLPELKAFFFQDPSIHIPIMLANRYGWGKEILPRHIPTEIRNSELLTYLTLYRAIMLQYVFSLNPWSHCPVKMLDVPRYFVPGYLLFHVVTVYLPSKILIRESDQTI